MRSHTGPLIGFSDETRELNQGLKTFLREHVYRHYKVQRMTSKAQARDDARCSMPSSADPRLMPEEHSVDRAAAARRTRERRAGRGPWPITSPA